MPQVNALVFVWVAANNVLSYRGAQKRQLTRINMTGGNGAVATNLCCGVDHVVKTGGEKQRPLVGYETVFHFPSPLLEPWK